MRIADIMSRNVVSVSDSQLARTAFDSMLRNSFRHLPVLDSTGELVGIVSDRDMRSILVVLDPEQRGPENSWIPESIAVRDIMSSDPISVPPDADVKKAVLIMKEKKFGCLPVVDQGKLVGVVTTMDLLSALAEVL